MTEEQGRDLEIAWLAARLYLENIRNFAQYVLKTNPDDDEVSGWILKLSEIGLKKSTLPS